MRITLAMLLVAGLAGCAAPETSAPSLAPRAAEAIDPRLPVGGEAVIGPAEAVLQARLTELIQTARAGDAAFSAAVAEAERLAAAAGEAQSESWVVAQQALSIAVAARAPTTRAQGDIDAIAADRIEANRWIAVGDRAAIEAAAAEVAALSSRQSDRIAALQSRLGG